MGKLLNKNIVIIGLIILYRVLLDYTYATITSPVWGYAGFGNNSTISSHIVSWIVLAALTFFILPYFKSTEPFYPDLLLLFFTMRVVPFTTIVRYVNIPDSLSIWFFVYFALIFIFTRRIKLRPMPLNIGRLSRSNDGILYVGLIFFSAIILFISGYYAHFRLHLSFDDVYDLRHESSSFNIPTIIRYVWSPATNILPLLFAYFLQKKKRIICFCIIIIIFLNFSINGMKSTIFKLLICVAFVLINFKDFKKYYLPGFICLLLLTLLEASIWDFHFIHDVVVRRAIFIPPLLDTYYYDYITQNGPMYYARGGTAVQYTIGELYYGSSDIECNNGLFSDAFMNLGILGCFIYPIVYAFMFRICGSAFRGAEKGLIVFAAIIMSYTLEGSELTTGLLTHGLFLFCVFLYIISIKSYVINNFIKTTNYVD